jgi:hypothetical protein
MSQRILDSREHPKLWQTEEFIHNLTTLKFYSFKDYCVGQANRSSKFGAHAVGLGTLGLKGICIEKLTTCTAK